MTSTRKEVANTVPITVCDLCGGEIDFDKEDRQATGSIGDFNPEKGHEGQPTSELPRIRFAWPIGKLLKKKLERYEEVRDEQKDVPYRDRIANPYPGTTWYDFHGACLAKLVIAAVGLRTKGPTEEPERVPHPLDELHAVIDSILQSGSTVELAPQKGAPWKTVAAMFNGVHVEPGQSSMLKRTFNITVTGPEA